LAFTCHLLFDLKNINLSPDISILLTYKVFSEKFCKVDEIMHILKKERNALELMHILRHLYIQNQIMKTIDYGHRFEVELKLALRFDKLEVLLRKDETNSYNLYIHIPLNTSNVKDATAAFHFRDSINKETAIELRGIIYFIISFV
jgi:hypothetical protein